MDFLVRQMLYPAPAIPVPSPPPPPLEEVTLELAGTPDRAVAWAYEHPAAEAATPAVLFFHGNGENLETMRFAGLYEQLAGLGLHFLAVDFPGYGRSTGVPSEASLTAAGSAGFAWLQRRFPRQPKVVLGWSLGAAVAVQTAARHADETDGLVLLAAWDDLKSLAGVHFPSWLVGFAVKDRYDSLAAAAELRLPTLLIHGEDDEIIPIGSGRRLHAALGREARFVAVPTTGHNDLLARQSVWHELGKFLDAVGSRGAATGS